MHNCQYIYSASNDPENGMQVVYCDRPASIKRDGIWLCPYHYDQIESDSWIADLTLPTSDPDERKLDKNRAFRYMYSR